jgi:hypothetical protein
MPDKREETIDPFQKCFVCDALKPEPPPGPQDLTGVPWSCLAHRHLEPKRFTKEWRDLMYRLKPELEAIHEANRPKTSQETIADLESRISQATLTNISLNSRGTNMKIPNMQVGGYQTCSDCGENYKGIHDCTSFSPPPSPPDDFMNDTNKLLDEIEKLPSGVIAYHCNIPSDDLKALATAYREQERLVREAVEELEELTEKLRVGWPVEHYKIAQSVLSKLRETAKPIKDK